MLTTEELKKCAASLSEGNFPLVFEVVREIYDALQLSNDPDVIYIPLDRPNERLRMLLPSDEDTNRSSFSELRESALDYLVSIQVVSGYEVLTKEGKSFAELEVFHHRGQYSLEIFHNALLMQKSRNEGREPVFDKNSGVFYWRAKKIEFRHDSLRYWVFRLTFEHRGNPVSFEEISEQRQREILKPDTEKQRVFTDAFNEINRKFKREYQIPQVLFSAGSKVTMRLPE